MAVYSGRGITSVSVSVQMCDCMWLYVWSYSNHTYMLPSSPPPSLHCWAATTSPRDTIKSAGRKSRPEPVDAETRQAHRASSFPSQVSEGSLARRRRPRDVRAVQKRNLSQHSWPTARPEAIPTRSIPLLALHWAVHAHTEGNRKFWSGQRFTAVKVVCVRELLNSQDMATDHFFFAVGQLYIRAKEKSVVPLKDTAGL